MRRLSFLALILSLGLVLAGNVHSAQERAIPAAEADSTNVKAADIYGLRSARFGMTENEVRRAISIDFPDHSGQTQKGIHPLEQTTILTLPVNDLLSDSGEAIVSYVLGFKTKKLTQINVNWRREANRENVIQLAALLVSIRNYFSRMEFTPKNKLINGVLPSGEIIAFRGVDSKGRMIVASGFGLTEIKKEDEKLKKPAQPLEVFLSYIESPDDPDIFGIKIGEGQL